MLRMVIRTNQVRSHGIIVDDVPIRFDLERKSRQAIYVPETGITLPLHTHGSTMYLPVRYPFNQELDECETIELNGKDTWDPYAESFESKEINALEVEPGLNSIETLSSMLISKIHVRGIKTTVKGELSSIFRSAWIQLNKR